MSRETLTIDVVSDVVCPWCYLGWRKLKLALDSRPGVDPQIQQLTDEFRRDYRAVQVEIGSERFDEQLAGGVVDEEGQVQSFIRHFLPFLLLAIALLPGGGVVEKATLARDGRGYCVRTGSRAGDLDQSQGGAANFGGRGGKQQTLAGKQLKSDKEKVQTTGNRDRRKNREDVDRDEEGKADGHSAFLDCLG